MRAVALAAIGLGLVLAPALAEKLPPPAQPLPKAKQGAELRGVLPPEPKRALRDAKIRGGAGPQGATARSPLRADNLRGVLPAQTTDSIQTASIRGSVDQTQGRAVEGLRGAVESAIASSLALRASLAEEKGAGFGVWRELARFTPTISGVAEHTWTEGSDPLRDGDTRYAGLQLTLPLFTSGQRLASVASARSIERAAHFRTATVRDGVILQTSEAYLQQVYAALAIEALERTESSMRQLAQSLNAQHRAGFASGADVSDVEAELAAVRQQIVELQVMRRKAYGKASSLAGAPVIARHGFPKLDQALSPGYAALRAAAMRRNPNVLVAQSSAEASRHASRAEMAKYLPQVGLNASYRRALEGTNVIDDRERWNVGVKLTVPLVDLSTVASIGESRQRAAADRYRAQDTVRQIADQLEALWLDRTGNLERRELMAARVADLRKVAEAAQARFKKGLIGLDLVLDAQRRLTSAELEAAQMDVQSALNDVQILITAGTFQPSMLALR